MHKVLSTLLFGGALAVAPQAVASHGCNADPAFEVHEFAGEVYGQHTFQAPVGRFRFALKPAEYGWQIAVFDNTTDEAVPVAAPPLRPIDTNPVYLSGWHFRNRDNSAPNRGEVNAPQQLRAFYFGRRAVDALLNPESVALDNALTVAPAEGDNGVGELMVEDMGLADLEPGQKARLVYLKFRGCLGWNRDPQTPPLAATADPGVPTIAVGRMLACGLDANTFRLSDRTTKGREGGQAAFLMPDLNGDGTADFVAPIEKRDSMEPGLAICMGSTEQLILAGFDGRIGEHLDPAYFNRVEFWAVHSGPIFATASEPAPPPVLKGDALLLGKEDSSSVIVYLDEALNVSSYWQGD